LSGLVFCGLCGASYNGNHSRSGNNIYLRYRCSGRQRKGDCNNEYIQKEVLEQAAVNAIVRQIERINIEELAETFNKCVNESAISASEEAKRIRKEIAAAEGKISVLLDALELGEDVKNRIKEHSQRKQELQLALLQVEKEASISRVTPEQVGKIIDNLDPRNVSDEQELRAIFFRLIKKIVICPGKKIIIYTIWDNDSVSCERVPLPTPALDTWQKLLIANIEES
jgi:site-specific DNA recombinase